jgi:hypothetical protein
LHPDLAGTFANVGLKGPLANLGFWWSSDWTFASRPRGEK